MKILNLIFEEYRYYASSEEELLKHAAKVEAVTDEDLRAQFTINVWNPEKTHQYSFSSFPKIGTEAQVTELLMAGFEFTVAPGITVTNPTPEVLFNPKVPEGPTDQHMNNRVEVHMPGQALSMYNETLLMEDSCTDALQNELANGWRIIAVCPQPDQRRPDYVLGRYNPNVGIDTEAKRG